MYRLESSHAMVTARLERGRGPVEGQSLPRPRQPADIAGKHLQVCREYEATRLILAALGRRRGPLD
ncbi:hypothetical protein [Benzoatithermus flavus]|uniref:Uncharacterized protein n=1 Tax=Benzoatithermus flavus TaxID=3108223 RepID=A0ABU8XVE8_9PROT